MAKTAGEINESKAGASLQLKRVSWHRFWRSFVMPQTDAAESDTMGASFPRPFDKSAVRRTFITNEPMSNPRPVSRPISFNDRPIKEQLTPKFS